MDIEPQYTLIVTDQAGLFILDTPRPQSLGALRRRAVPVGTPLHAYDIVSFGGVPYAYLVPQNAARPEWVRVSEAGGVLFDADGKFVSQQVEGVKAYVKVIRKATTTDDALADAINNLADAIRSCGK